MCFGCRGGDDEGVPPRQHTNGIVAEQPAGMEMSHSGIDRKREDREDVELSASQQKMIKAFRSWIEGSEDTPAGPRMEHLYREFRSAIRAVALALEEEPTSNELPLHVIFNFLQRQVDRCRDAQGLAGSTYELCVREAEEFRKMGGAGETLAEGIMSYAVILPSLQKIMEDAILPREKARNAVKTDMDKSTIPQSRETQAAPPVIDRDREDREDAELSETHRRAIKGFRRFTEERAAAPDGPRMETLYQQYRSAIRAAGLALENPSKEQTPSLDAALAFHQRQTSRCYEAAAMLHGAYALCSLEAGRADNGGRVAANIMAYAAILEALKDAMGSTILREMKTRDEIQANINKMSE